MNLEQVLQTLIPKKTADESTVYIILKQYAVLKVCEKSCSQSIYEEINAFFKKSITDESISNNINFHNKYLFCLIFLYQQLKQENKQVEIDILQRLFEFTLNLTLTSSTINHYFVLKTLNKLLVKQGGEQIQQMIREYLNTEVILESAVLQFYKSLKEKVEHAEIESAHEQQLRKQEILIDFYTEYVQLNIKKGLYEQISESFKATTHDLFQIYIWNQDTSSLFQQICTHQLNQFDFSKYNISNTYNSSYFNKLREIFFKFFRSLCFAQNLIQQDFTQEFKKRYLEQRNYQKGQPSNQHQILCFEVIKFVELLHSKKKYDLNDEVVKSDFYWNDLKNTLEQYENIEVCKQGINALNGILESISIRFNEKDIKNDKNLLEYSKVYTKKYKTFVDLYITLDSFAVHLIKSLWPQLVKFIEKDPAGINTILEKVPILSHLTSYWPVFILFKKSIFHNNQSIVKCCVKYFLKMEEVDINELQDLVYDYAVPILNNSLFYNDATLDADSKFYSVVQTFFLNAYSKMLKNLKEELDLQNKGSEYEQRRKELLNHHLKRLLSSICKHILHPQAVCAFLQIFSTLKEQSTFLGVYEMKSIVDYTQRCYSRANIRKRTIFARGLISLILNHLDVESTTNYDILDFIFNFPQQAFEWKSLSQFNGQTHLLSFDINTFQDEIYHSFLFKNKLLYFFIKNADKLKLSVYFNDLKTSINSSHQTISNEESTNQNDSVSVQFNKLIHLSSILLEVPSYSEAIKQLIDNNKEQKDQLELSFIYKFSQEGNLSEFVSSWLFSSKLNDIYTNSYRPHEVSTKALLQLNSILSLFKNTKEMQRIHEYLDSVSADVLSYLMIRVSEKDYNSKQHADFVYHQTKILDLFYNLYYYAIQPQYLRPSLKLSTSLGKAIKSIFSQTFALLQQTSSENKNESILSAADEESVCLHFELLSRICRSNLDVIQQSLKNATTTSSSVFIDDLIFEQGLALVEILALYDSSSVQTYPVLKQLALKRGFLSKSHVLLCNLMSVLSFSSELMEHSRFGNILEKVVSDSHYLADVFDINRLDELFIMLKYVYNPYLITHLNSDNAESLIKQFYNLFEMCLTQNLLGSQLTNLTYKEVHYMYEWALDSSLFYNSHIIQSNVLQQIVKLTLKSGENYWLLQRKVVDRLFFVYFQDPSLIISFSKTIYKIIKISEYRGFDNGIEFYNEELEIPCANELKNKQQNNTEYFGAYPRFMMLKLMENIVIWINKCVEHPEELVDEQVKTKFICLIKFFIDFTTSLLERNYKKKYQKSRNSLLPCTEHYMTKIRVWQCICIVKELFTANVMHFIQNTTHIDIDVQTLLQNYKDKLWGILDFNNQINIRQYIEIFTLHLYNQFPTLFEQSIIDGIKEKNNRSQYAIPLIFMAGYQLCRKPENPRAKEILSHLFPYTGSHVAYLRSIAQYFVFKFTDSNQEFIKDDPLLSNLHDYFAENKESIRMKKTFEKIVDKFERVIENFNTEKLLSIDMDGNGDIIHENVIEEIKTACMNLIYQMKEIEDAPPKKEDMWKIKTEEFIKDVPIPDLSEVTNFQRKIDVVQNELDQIEIEKKKRRKEKDIIVVASLLEKTPNFGHLTRTSEIFGVSSLTIPNKGILEEDGFKAISVTAEKWLPIQEVKEKDLMSFLILKKKLGYKIVGLEQTSKSKMIQGTEFPDKCVLLLGKEKTGIPLEYIEILDQCVEIPQFGQIRSLNVHISAVICIWEFVKQKFIKE